MEHLASGCTYHVRAKLGLRSSARSEKRRLAEGKLSDPLDPPDPIVLVLPPDGILRGHVTDANGRPVEEAHVRVVGFYRSGQPQRMEQKDRPEGSVTGSGGRFTIDGLVQATRYEVLVSGPQFAPMYAGPLTALPHRTHKLQVSGGAVLAGRVVSADDGTPVAEARIWGHRIDRQHEHEDVKWTVQTNEEGAFRAPFLAPGRYAIGGRFGDGQDMLVVMPTSCRVRERIDNQLQMKAFVPITIRGSVVDGQNRPLQNAEVRFKNQRRLSDVPRIFPRKPQFCLGAETTSDAQGRFVVGCLLHGRLEGRARLQGYVADGRTVSAHYRFGLSNYHPDATVTEPIVCRPGQVVEGVSIRLMAKRHDTYEQKKTISGVVLDPDGRPVEGIRVVSYFESGQMNRTITHSIGQTTTTDGSGRYSITDKRKHLMSVAVMPTDEHPYHGRGSGELRLRRCGRMAGTALDDNGKPVVGAWVIAQADNNFFIHPGGFETSTKTDDEGRFQFGWLPPDQWRVYAGRKGYHRGKQGEVKVELREGVIVQDLLLRLARTQRFNGRLVDQHGNPLAGWRTPGEETGEDGSFSYSLHHGEEKNTLRFSFTDSDVRMSFRSGTIRFPTRSPRDGQEFALSLHGSVTGRVVIAETGGPAVGLDGELEIDWKKRQVSQVFSECKLRRLHVRRTDLVGPDGTFELRGVPPGHFTLTLSGDAIAATRIDDVRVDEALHADRGVITVRTGRVITGHLIDATRGQPVDGASYVVTAEAARRDGSPMVLTVKHVDHEGSFRMTQLPVDVESLTIVAERRGSKSRQMWPSKYDLIGSIQSLDLADIIETDLGQVHLRTYGLRGRLVRDRRPVRSNVRLAGKGNGFDLNGSVAERDVSIDGVFTVERVRPDIDMLRVTVSGYLPALVEKLPAPDENGFMSIGDIVLDPGHTVRGTLRGPNGEAARDGHVSIGDSQGYYQNTSTDERGQFMISGFHPGPANVSAAAQNDRDSNAWIKGGGNPSVEMRNHKFVIRQDGQTSLELTFPSSDGR